jgi:hypothetical protein
MITHGSIDPRDDSKSHSQSLVIGRLLFMWITSSSIEKDLPDLLVIRGEVDNRGGEPWQQT